MEQADLSQLLLTDPHTIAYLTGDEIAPGERFLGLLLRRGREPLLFLNRLFTAPGMLPEQIAFYEDGQRGAVLAAEHTDRDAALGVDKKMAAEFLLELQDSGAAASYRNGSPVADRVRACKDAEEIARMKAASLLNDEAMERLKRQARPGVTERQLAAALLDIYRELGTDGPSFDPIISFGANAADPHHAPDDTVLRPGMCMVFDIGCRKDGYCSDMTRTYFCKEVRDRDRQVYELVRRANLAGEAAIGPGVRFCDIDEAARAVIRQGGYGPCFTHRLGHSIGREVHEWGDVSAANPQPVQPGMIFSCEPGIYLPGETGVRIEDLCLVTEDGVCILNHSPKELEVLPG